MGTSKVIAALAVSLLMSCARQVSSEPPPIELPVDCSMAPSYTLYLAGQKQVAEAIHHYRMRIEEGQPHDFELLRHLSLTLLEQGLASPNEVDQIMALFGAGLAEHPSLIPILRSGLSNPNPQVQLLSIQLLAQRHDDIADELLNHAVTSPHVLTRLEAIYQLVLKRHPAALGQTESILVRLPPEAEPLFPQLYAMIGDRHADARLRQMLGSANSDTRCASIAAIATAGRDDFLPTLRTLSHQLDLPQQEAAATALGALKDELSAERLTQLSRSPDEQVQIAANLALYKLGRLHLSLALAEFAKSENLYAITSLAEVAGSEEVLASLLQSPNSAVRVNAALSLLQRQDGRCLPVIEQLLIRGKEEIALTPHRSVGGSLSCFKLHPSFDQQLRENPIAGELIRQLRERILVETLNLSEEEFLSLANKIFQRRQNDLVPTLVRLLENLHTERAIALLKRGQQQLGAPLIRDYCTLALYRLGEPGPWEEQLLDWVERQRHLDLIQLRPVLPWDERSTPEGATAYQITAEEGSRLLVETLEALAQSQSEAAINAILLTMERGNIHNRYALAGLLVLAIQ